MAEWRLNSTDMPHSKRQGMRIKDEHNRQAWQSEHGTSVLTSVCLVIGFNLRKRGLSIISHTWKRNMMMMDKSGNAHPSSPHPRFSAPACICVSMYTCLWTWMSQGSGGPPVVYQPRNSSSLNTCLTAEKGARAQSISLNHPSLIWSHWFIFASLSPSPLKS